MLEEESFAPDDVDVLEAFESPPDPFERLSVR